MSDNVAAHLDGCPLDSPCHVTEAVHRVESVGGAHPHDRCAICTWWCICPALRACEARVREEEQAAATLEIAHKTGEHYAYGRADALTQMLDAGNVMGQEFYAKGYAAALDAARDAVAALDRFHFSAARSRGYPALTVTPVAADYPDSYLFPPAALAAIAALRAES